MKRRLNFLGICTVFSLAFVVSLSLNKTTSNNANGHATAGEMVYEGGDGKVTTGFDATETQLSLSYVGGSTGSAFSGEGLGNLTDNYNYNKWCSYTSNGYFNLIYKSSAAKVLTKYQLVCANDTSSYSTRNWKNWKIYGSNSSSGSWTLLVNHSGANGTSAYSTYTYTDVTPSSAFNYFRIEFTVPYDSSNGKYTQQMAEMKLFGTDAAITVKWLNYDGNVIETDSNLAPGSTPVFNSATPTRPATAQYTYTFSGWSPSVGAVYANTNYTAQFTPTVKTYNVVWKNYDGSILETDSAVAYGATPTYNSATPVKPADAQYTYTFAGWSPTITAVTGNAEYTALYSKTLNNYKITWKNWDDTVLEIDPEVQYGTMPTYNGDLPTKASCAQYSYTFLGWSPSITTVTGDKVYVAQFTSVVNKYTVTWKNHDGSILEEDKNVPYGDTPYYNGETPKRAADAHFTYTFCGWDPEVSEVTGDTIYTAQFTSEVNVYSVIWKNDNGEILEADYSVSYGTMPSYDGETPTKQKTAQYTYTFVGWSPVVEVVTGDAIYVAQYSATINKYTITWKNFNGNVLEVDSNVAYGEMPSYDGDEPVRQATAQYTYSFSGWSPVVSTVSGNTTYVAQFNRTINRYTITWKNFDGSILEVDNEIPYGEMPKFDGATPAKARTAKYSYEFKGWSPVVKTVTGNAEYIAQFDEIINKYEVKFVNWNGEELQKEDLEYGSMPNYNGITPTKVGDAQYAYAFTGWDKEIVTVTEDVVYTAQFSSSVNKYYIAFEDWDGVTIQGGDVAYGAVPVFTGATPTKEGNQQFSYRFAGWNKPLVPVTEKTIYTATYEIITNKYKVTFQNWDGTILQESDIEYGSTPIYSGDVPTRQGDAQFSYTFSKWDKELKPVTADVTYTARFSYTVNKYDITWQNADGTILEVDEDVAFGEVPSYDGETPTQEAGEQFSYTFCGWSPEVIEVTGDVTYVAQYEEILNQYDVHFLNWDGSEVATVKFDYGSTPFYNGEDPVKVGDAQYSYEFDGWDRDFEVLTGETSYTAQFKKVLNKYTVLFENWDGSELQKDTVEYGSMPEYLGQEVVREADAEYSYEFIGWGEEGVNPVSGNIVYTAQFAKIKNKYKVSFDNNGHGASVGSMTIEYGSSIDVPNKPVDSEFVFLGWYTDKELTNPWDFNEDKIQGNLVLYAKWGRNAVEKYTPVYVAVGATSAAAVVGTPVLVILKKSGKLLKLFRVIKK